MKPVIKRSRMQGYKARGEQRPVGWVCLSGCDPGQSFCERLDTWAKTPFAAWQKWFERNRKQAALRIDDVILTPPLRLKNCSMLARMTLGLIRHDRYLLKVDSRQPCGKGNM